MNVYACVRACACVRAGVRACVRAGGRAGVREYHVQVNHGVESCLVTLS